MTARMLVELPSGRKLFVGGIGAEAGLSEVGIAEVATTGMDKFRGALASLSDLVDALDQSIGKLARRPDKVEIEFSLSLTGDCNLWVVSGEASAEFKVTLGWDKSE